MIKFFQSLIFLMQKRKGGGDLGMQFIVAMAMSVTVRWSSRQFVVVHILGKTEVRNIYISLFHIISSLEKQILKHSCFQVRPELFSQPIIGPTCKCNHSLKLGTSYKNSQRILVPFAILVMFALQHVYQGVPKKCFFSFSILFLPELPNGVKVHHKKFQKHKPINKKPPAPFQFYIVITMGK